MPKAYGRYDDEKVSSKIDVFAELIPSDLLNQNVPEIPYPNLRGDECSDGRGRAGLPSQPLASGVLLTPASPFTPHLPVAFYTFILPSLLLPNLHSTRNTEQLFNVHIHAPCFSHCLRRALLRYNICVKCK